MKLIQLGVKQFAVVLVTLVIAGFLALGGGDWWDVWYYDGFVGTALRQELGFQTGNLENGAYWGFTDVSPGGVLERAGVRPGDIPVRVSHVSMLDGTRQMGELGYHGRENAIMGFYYFLERNRGKGPVVFIVRHPISKDPCSRDEREITVTVPRGAAPQ